VSNAANPPAADSGTSQPLAGPLHDVFNYAASVHLVGDDADLLAQLVAVFIEQLPQLLGPLAASVANKDAKAIRQTAHALTSSVSVLSAPGTRNLAHQLELMGLNSDLAAVDQVHTELLHELSRLLHVLNSSSSFKAA